VWSGLNVQKNRVFLIYKKLIGGLHKVAQEWGEASDMGMGEKRCGGAAIWWGKAPPNNGRTRIFKRYEAHM
jgi:hypothetical protein